MFTKLLIANRGEIAIRISRAAAELDLTTLGIYSEDDSQSLHRYHTTESVPLSGNGAGAYLDQEQILALARQHQCDAIHPGYGFLSENPDFARLCDEKGFCFVGPTPAHLALFGDKSRSRQLAAETGVPVTEGTEADITLEQARAFFHRHYNQPMVIKALAGGGGRGMRIVREENELDSAFERCQSEARAAFGDHRVYAETFFPRARHIEVQIAADNDGHVVHLWERDCSIQRRFQKLVEVAPAPQLDTALRQQLLDSALSMARAAGYQNLGTFEFLVDPASGRFVFLEANPRLQVEHTVTEAVTGIDLVVTQLQLAAGNTLAQLNLEQPPTCRGMAIQTRLNLETIAADGTVKPAGGQIQRFSLPSGPGVRVDTFGYAGYTPSPRFDSLLAKLVVSASGGHWEALCNKTANALLEFDSAPVASNRPLLWALLNHADVQNWALHTRWLDENLAELVARQQQCPAAGLPAMETAASSTDTSANAPSTASLPADQTPVVSPLQGTVVSVMAASGESVSPGQELLILESMKMEHVISAETGGRVGDILVRDGDTIAESTPLLGLIPSGENTANRAAEAEEDPHQIRAALQEVIDHHAYGLDANRPEAVARRRKTGQRTAQENIEDLCDEGSFQEYGALVIAAQRARRSLQELMEKTPGDGLIGGFATVNSQLFGADNSQVIAMTYDYTVFAGTQGQKNHRKKDRLFEKALEWRLPVVVFAEGGGGRPGETERNSASGLDCLAFWYYARLKGQCPLVSIVSGRCFAGNAVLAGCSDVIIATENANIGMGGPAMIEGGGLGVFKPEDVGPVEYQRANGVIDIVVPDETAAVAAARQYLGYFQGDLADWQAPDQLRLRTLVPENRLRVYDVRQVIDTLADVDSVLELRRDFAPGMITSLARIEGKAVGIVANNPLHLGGAIDSEGSDKAARFIQLCNSFGIPLLFLCDTPGIMVGPEAEKTALVRHAARMFVAGASVQVPFFTIVLRKAYGLGAQTMAGGSFKAPVFTVSWPTGEFGGMGLEGAVQLGYRNELAAIEDPQEREALFQEKVAAMYELGKATSVAAWFDLDDVIDPAESRRWIVRGLAAARPAGNDKPGTGNYVDTW